MDSKRLMDAMNKFGKGGGMPGGSAGFKGLGLLAAALGIGWGAYQAAFTGITIFKI